MSILPEFHSPPNNYYVIYSTKWETGISPYGLWRVRGVSEVKQYPSGSG